MNKLVMLSEVKQEKIESNLSKDNDEVKQDSVHNNNEEYLSFNNKFSTIGNMKNITLDECIEDDIISSINKNKLDENLKRIFLLENNKPFLDFINEIFDDCLGTNCSIEYDDCSEDNRNIMAGILKDPSNRIRVNAKDEYRNFEYNIQIQTYDYANIAITISKAYLNSNCINVINLDQKKKQYKSHSKKDMNDNDSDLYMIMVNSNIRVPDSYEVRQECNGNTNSYKFNVLKSWKYDFKDLYERNLYMLFPLKVFDLKKCIDYMDNSSYSKEMIEKEIIRFLNEMNRYLDKVKERKSINDSDIRKFNSIARELINSFND